MLENRAYRKAGMPDYQNVEKKIVAIPRVWVICTVLQSSLFIANAVNKDRKIDIYSEAFGPIISEIVELFVNWVPIRPRTWTKESGIKLINQFNYRIYLKSAYSGVKSFIYL